MTHGNLTTPPWRDAADSQGNASSHIISTWVILQKVIPGVQLLQPESKNTATEEDARTSGATTHGSSQLSRSGGPRL